MKRLIITAVGLALVGGIIIGGIVSNQFGVTPQRTSAAEATGGVCYTNWNSADCAAGYTAVSVGEWTGLLMHTGSAISAGGIVCAAPKAAPDTGVAFASLAANQAFHWVNHVPCAICCATGASVVGGFAEAPAVAGPLDTSGMGGATYAVLVGAAAGILAFAVMGILAVKRRGVQQ